ncbi:MAG: LPP20 family lipoprotein [Rickettsiales bacterium]|jgi:hypothetical protein|nr:LPP20 family lipoprotein [Rickettsiales bacterium]
MRKKQNRVRVILIWFFFLFQLQNVVVPALPNWYTTKQEDSSLYIYEIGEGKTKDKAIANAIDNLSTRISSETSGWGVDIKDIIDFPAYFLEQNTKNNDIHYVLLSFNKKEFFGLQVKNLQDDEKFLLNQLKKLERKNDLLKLRDYENIHRIIIRIKLRIQTIKFFENFDDTKYRKLFEKIDNNYRRLLKHQDISISIEDKRLGGLYDSVKKYFNKRSIVVKNKSNNVFSVETDIESDYLYDNYLISGNVKFLLKSQNKIVLYNSVSVQCGSTTSYGDCFKKILLQIEEIFNNREDIFVDESFEEP